MERDPSPRTEIRIDLSIGKFQMKSLNDDKLQITKTNDFQRKESLTVDKDDVWKLKAFIDTISKILGA